MTKILFPLGLCWGWCQWNGGRRILNRKKAAMSKTFPALSGALEHEESYGKGYLPDSPSVLS